MRNKNMEKTKIIEEYLEKNHIDAWIIVDYENRNKTLVSFLGEKMLTRKIIMVFEKNRKPYLITHTIDTVFLKDLQDKFDLVVYKTWKEMLQLEKKMFKDYKKVCMDISEDGLLPRISLADYGSVEYVKSLGIEAVSSGDLLQRFLACYDKESYALQEEAIEKSLRIKDEAFRFIKKEIEEKGKTDEYQVQQYISRRFHEEGMVYDDEPIVAINSNASNPHYGPTKEIHSDIAEGDCVLIDMWAKMDHPKAVYSDITWMGYVGKEVPKVYEDRFQILRRAVDTAFDFLRQELPLREVFGYEVDDVAREVVEKSGYGEYFTHRTGHNIAVDVSPHGPGVNIDNYESHDTRKIIPNISFSLEPGIYAPDFGMRSETNVYIDEDKVPHMVAGRQEHVIAILK
mgnify:CR=1 FL=1